MFLPSASRLEIAEYCIGSAVLPGIEYVDADAAAGTVKHRFLETALNEGEAAALAGVTDEKLKTELAGWDLSKFPAGQRGAWAAEVAYAFNAETGAVRELGRRIERGYAAAGLKANEFPGTLDLVGVTADAVVVLDYKTGHQMVAPAARNWQLRYGAVSAAKVLKKSKAVVGIFYTRDGEEPYLDSAELDAFDLDDGATSLKSLGARIIEARKLKPSQLRLTAGEHCRYCPAVATCPAQAGLVQRLATNGDATVAELASLLTPETAALAYGRIKAAKMAIAKVESALYSYAAQNPVPLGDGYVLGTHVTERESLDGKKTFEVLKELHGLAVAQAAVEMETSKAAVKRALEIVKTAEGGATAPRQRVVEERVRKAGGITVTRKSTIGEHRPKKGELPAPTPAPELAAPATPGKSMQELLAEEEALRAAERSKTKPKKDLF